MYLARIRGRRSNGSAVPVPGEKVRLRSPLHHYGLRNLQAVEFLDRRNPKAVISALFTDYRFARQRIFAGPSLSPPPDSGERSTMQGMGLYLGIALWQTRKGQKSDPLLEQCLADARQIHAYSGSRARCIATPAMYEAAKGWEPALNATRGK